MVIQMVKIDFCHIFDVYLKVQSLILSLSIHFSHPVFHFFTRWRRRKTKGFQGVKKWNIRLEMSWSKLSHFRCVELNFNFDGSIFVKEY